MDNIKKSTKFKYVKSTFEYLTVKKIPYWIYWPVIGVILYIFSEIIIFYFEEKRFFISRIVLILEVFSWPITYIYFSRRFYNLMEDIHTIFWQNKKDADIWYNHQAEKIFTLKPISSRILVLFFSILLILTLLCLGLPFTNNIINITLVFVFFFISFIPANGVLIVFYNFVILQDLSKLNPEIPFFLFPNTCLIKIKRHLFSGTSIIAIVVFVLIVGFNYSPYGLNFLLKLWLFAIALFPLCLFFWALSKVQEIITTAKDNQIKLINDRIQKLLNGLLNDDEKSINNLIKYMDMQQKISSISEWSLDPKSIIALMIALLPILFQIYTQIQK